MTPSDLPPIDPDAARLAASALRPGEEIVWAGRPDERRTARRDPRLVGLGIFWSVLAGAAFYGFAVTLLSDEYGGLPIAVRIVALTVCAAPFLLAAVYMLGGHVSLRRRTRSRTGYVVTADRVLVTSPALGAFGRPRVRELDRDSIGRVDVEEPACGGVADITVTDATGRHPAVTLQLVRGAEVVAELLRAQAAG